jgi:hypothetical protein
MLLHVRRRGQVWASRGICATAFDERLQLHSGWLSYGAAAHGDGIRSFQTLIQRIVTRFDTVHTLPKDSWAHQCGMY